MKLERKAEKYALEAGAKVRDHGSIAVTLRNTRALAEVNAKEGYFAGYNQALKDAADKVRIWDDASAATIIREILALGEER